MINRSRVLGMQNEWEKKAKQITDVFIESNPKFYEMRYSLLWTAYHTLRNDRFKLLNKNKKKYYFLNGKVSGKYFIQRGIKRGLLKQIEKNGIRSHDFYITSKNIGFQLPKRTIFPLSYTNMKGNINIDLENNAIKSNFKAIINNNFVDMKRLSNLLIRMFNYNKPQFVILSEDRTKYNRVIVKAAKKFEIPVFILQHGITPKVKTNQMPFANESFAPLYGDYILVWGKNAKQYLKEIGINENKILICGNPDYNINNTRNTRKKELLIIDQQFIGQKNEMELSYKPLIETLNKNRIPYKIYLRMEYNRKYIENLTDGKHIIKWKKGLIRKLIKEYNLTLGFYSTAIMESVINLTPSISFDSMNRGDVMGFHSKYLKCITDVDEIIKAYKLMIDVNPKIDDVKIDIENHIAYYGEEAVNKIVNSIYGKI